MEPCKHREMLNGHNPKKGAMAFIPVYYCKILRKTIAKYLCEDCKYKEVKK